RPASSNTAVADSPSTPGSRATNVSHPREKPYGAVVDGFAVNIAVTTPACRAASAIVTTDDASAASPSDAPCWRGDTPVNIDPIAPPPQPDVARSAPNTIPPAPFEADASAASSGI